MGGAMQLNPKILFAIAAVGIVILLNIISFSGKDPYEKIDSAPDTPQVEAARYVSEDAYLLIIYSMDSSTAEIDPEAMYHNWIDRDLGEAIWNELQETLSPLGVNRSYGEFNEQGNLGTIEFDCIITEQSFGDGQGRSGRLPKIIDASFTMETSGSSHPLDGTKEISAEIDLPHKISQHSIDRERREAARRLATKLIDQIK